jgi:hypothetical protein
MPEMEGGEQCPLVNAVLVGVNNVDLLETGLLGYRSGGVFVQHAKVTAQRQLVFDGEIKLVAEDYDSAEGDEASCESVSGVSRKWIPIYTQIVLLLVCQVLEFDANNLCADLRVVVEAINSIRKEVLVLRVTEEPLILVGDLFERRVEERREIWLEMLVLIVLRRWLDNRLAGSEARLQGLLNGVGGVGGVGGVPDGELPERIGRSHDGLLACRYEMLRMCGLDCGGDSSCKNKNDGESSSIGIDLTLGQLTNVE